MSQNHTQANSQELPVIGILGDGQLAMMMAQAYKKIGGQTFVFGESLDAPASQVADRFILGDSKNFDDLLSFFKLVDVVTLENEFIDAQLLIDAAEQSSIPVLPDPGRYRLIEDKLSEKRFFQNLGISVANFFEVKSNDDLSDNAGFLKLAKGGYDGIGTYPVSNRAEAEAIFEKIKSAGTVLFEQQVDFAKELSMIAVANASEIVCYPLVETHQEQQVCRYVSYPSGVSQEIENQAIAAATSIMQELNTRGLFAFEFFLTKDDQLILNESAPRPHNSGHITLDLMDCSQFENHMRSVADMQLINPTLVTESALMINMLGTYNGEFDTGKFKPLDEQDELTVKLYGKKESRVKRKMGHINLWGDNQWQRAKSLINEFEI